MLPAVFSSARVGYLLGAAVCLALLGFALYAQYAWGMSPCPLCVFQRIGFVAMGALFLAGGLHAPKRGGRWIYLALLLLVGLAGAGVAGRHLWIQSLPPSQVPSCGPGLGYLFRSFPFAKMLSIVLAGSGECAKIERILGWPVPAWSLLWFLSLAGWAAVVTARVGRRRKKEA